MGPLFRILALLLLAGPPATQGYAGGLLQPALTIPDPAVAQADNRSVALDDQVAVETPPLGSEPVRPAQEHGDPRAFNASIESLPDGSDTRFRPMSDWERNRWRIVLFAAGLLLQMFLITWLLYADRRRRTAEANAALLHAELAHSNRVATAGALTGSIAHEIRQPLTAIVSSASAGLNFLNHKVPNLGEVRLALQHIVREGHRADTVIANIRTMFRKDATQRLPCDVNKLIRDVLSIADGQMRTASVATRTRLPDSPPVVVTGDPVQLRQVILNLVMNAVEAMSAVPPDSRLLQVTTGSDHGLVWITVRDSGPGIASDALAHIFDPFFTTKPGGMGMGLSICKTIVEAHGGELAASQSPEGGAAFRILLPLHGAAAR